MTLDPVIYQYKYATLFLFAFVGGPTLALLCGFLIARGDLLALPAFLILVFANFIPDVVMYFIGQRLRKRGAKALGKRFPVMEKYREGMEVMWRDFFRVTLVLSKVSLGLAMPFLASAGFSRVPFRKYITHTVMLDIILISTLLTIGAFTGTAYERLVAYSNYVAALFALMLILMVSAVVKVTERRARSELLKRIPKSSQ